MDPCISQTSLTTIPLADDVYQCNAYVPGSTSYSILEENKWVISTSKKSDKFYAQVYSY
jgi:hypothetical protein